MTAVPFRIESLPEVANWFVLRGLPELTSDFLSTVGYWVPGVAAGWLYTMNAPGFAFLDNFITNSAAPRAERREALESIARALVRDADAAGCKKILALTQTTSIAELAGRLGFHLLQYDCCLFARVVT